MDLDAVGKTENLSHGAAMHKRNVRPRHRAKTRRVSAAPAAMVRQFYRFVGDILLISCKDSREAP